MNEVKAKIQELLKKSKERLNAARLLIKSGYKSDAVNRLYYAVFYTAQALVLAHNLKAKTHSGLFSQVGLLIVAKRYSKELSRIFRKLMEARESADYEEFAFFSDKELKEFFKDANFFVREVKKIIRFRV